MGKALKRHVTPLLRAAGFDDISGRRFWRHDGARTDHLEISSLSTYRALTDNATTASFHVRLGISLPDYGFQHDPRQREFVASGPSGPRPRESQMPIRGVLCPGDAPALQQGRWGWECRSLWKVHSVDEAEQAAIDLRRQLESYALDWMAREWDLHEFLTLLESPETRLFIATTDNGSHLELDAELAGSPIRQSHISMVKNALGIDS